MIEAKETLTGDITSKQFIEGSLNVKEVKVYPEIEDITIVPTKEQQTFTHEDSYGYDKVTVDPIPDEYIIPDGTLPITENATYDVRSYARVSASVYPAPNLQDKEVTITENGTQSIVADDDYDGLANVQVSVQVESSSGGKMPPMINMITPSVYRKDYSGVTSVTTNAVTIADSQTDYKESGDTSSIVLPSIVAIYVRSDYTLSDNLTLIDETDWTTYSGGTKQKLVICWCDNANEDFTITLAASGRMGVGIVSFVNSQKPTITTILNECNYKINKQTLPLKKGLTIYLATCIIGDTIAYSFYKNSNYAGNAAQPMRIFSQWDKTHLTNYSASIRLGIYAYYTEDDCETLLTGTTRSDSDVSIIGITCE